jgi:hypothetical protein
MSLDTAQWALKRIKENLEAHDPFAVDEEWRYLHEMLLAVVDSLITEID